MTTRRMVAGLVLLVMFGNGCSAWHWQTDRPGAVLERKQPKRVRVMLPDSSKVMVWQPVIERDTLRGFAADTADAEPLAVPLDRVRRVELYEPDAFATLLLVFSAAVALLFYGASQIPET